MLPLVPIAIGLASKYVPELIRTAFSNDKAAEVAKTVIDLAKNSTGLQEPNEALNKFEQQLRDNSDLQIELMKQVTAVMQMQVGDVQHARETLKDDHTTSKLAYLVMVGNVPLIMLCIGLLVWVTSVDLSDGQLAAVSAIIGGCLNQLYQERQQVMNYRFGSSIGEKLRGLLK